jgi:uncharacterized membrane protein YkvA (DUF1232 family)
MSGVQADFYQTLRRKIRVRFGSRKRLGRSAEYLLAAPDLFHLLCRLAADPDVPAAQKAKLLAAIAYFIAPFDLLPEAIAGVTGYLDDLALTAYVLDTVVGKVDPDVVRRHWAGDADVLDLIQRILRSVDRMVGSRVGRRVRNLAQ